MNLDHLLGLLELGLGALGAPAQGGELRAPAVGRLAPTPTAQRLPGRQRVVCASFATVARAPARLAIGGALLSAIAARGILRRAE